MKFLYSSYKGGKKGMKFKEKRRLFFKELQFVKSITLNRFRVTFFNNNNHK